MSRIALISGPLCAVALGGLLFLGSAAGQAKGDPEGYTVEVAVDPGEASYAETDDDEFDDGEPFPWPDFVGVQPQPGRYRMKITVGDLQLPEIPEAAELGMDMGEIMRSSLTKSDTFCIAPDFQPSGDWLGDRADDDCGEPEITVNGNAFTFALQCTERSGGLVNLNVTGTVYEDRSRMLFNVEASEEDFGEMTMQLRVATDRIGDCN